MVEVIVLGLSVVEAEVVGLLVVVTVPLPWGVVVVFMLLVVIDVEVVGFDVVVVPLLDALVVVLILVLLVVIDEEEVGLEDVLLDPVVLTEVEVFVLEEELALELKLVEMEEEP